MSNPSAVDLEWKEKDKLISRLLDEADEDAYEHDFEEEQQQEVKKPLTPTAPKAGAPRGGRTIVEKKIALEEIIQEVNREEDALVKHALMDASEEVKKSIEKVKPLEVNPEESSSDSDSNESDIEENLSDLDISLQIACYRGKENDVETLIKKGASIKKKDKHGWTPLHWVASQGFAKLVDLLCLSIHDEREKKKYV